EFHLSFTISNYLWIIGIFLVSLPIHELFHGIFFRYFSKSGKKVKYGFSKGMLYASNPGEVYTKRQFVIIILAPFILNSTLFLLLSRSGLEVLVCWILFFLIKEGFLGNSCKIYEIIRIQPLRIVKIRQSV